MTGADYMTLYLEYQKHYGLRGTHSTTLRDRLGRDTDEVLDDFWRQLRIDQLARPFEPGPDDVDAIEDEDTVLAAWGRLGMPANFASFAVWTERITTPGQSDLEPRLLPLVTRDELLNLAAAGGARGTAYSCESCREWQRRELIAWAWIARADKDDS